MKEVYYNNRTHNRLVSSHSVSETKKNVYYIHNCKPINQNEIFRNKTVHLMWK